MIDPIIFILRFIFDFWWLILPTLLIQICFEKFKNNQKKEYQKNLKWSFLELHFPQDITRTPKAMEEVFNSLHSIAPDVKTDLNWYNLNIKGFAPKSYNLIIIAHNNKLKFYIRFPENLKNFVKTRFYSQYPGIRFIDTEDPLKIMPPVIPNKLFDCEIYDAKLSKEDCYPIKTYVDIEKLPEKQQIDPITVFSEGAMNISNKEWLIFQINILPTTPDNHIHGKNWIERGNKVINKLIGKSEKKEQSLIDEIEEFIKNLILAPFIEPVWRKEEKKEEKEFNFSRLTPGEKKIIEAIQTKLSKFGYWCNWRIAYIATKDIFSTKKNEINSLINSILRNFSLENLNSFKLTNLTSIQKFKEKELFREFVLKNIHYNDLLKYKPVKLPPRIAAELKAKNLNEGFILNAEELASLFHPPMYFVPPWGIERIDLKELPPPFLE